MQIIENAIGGKRVVSSSTRKSAVYNPATGEQIAELPLSTNAEIDAAVAAAKAAQPAWGATPPLKRARVMFRFKELLDKHAADVAREISREHGKTHDDALVEVQRGIDVRKGILFLSTPSGFIHRGRCGVADPRCEPVLRLVRIQRRQGIERGISVHLPGRMARNLRRWTGEGV